ncbi:MAG: SLC13 family permease [Dehalococcoidales bacterium]|nr:SLC13 family permease [Dehalococcoidales bacterium]
MADSSMILVGAVVVVTMAFFAWGKVRIDIVALCSLVLLFILKLVTPEDVLFGIANEATVTIASMFILSAGLARTGLVEWAARKLDRLAGKTELRLMLVISLTAALLSAFIINAAIVAIFIPVAMVLSKSRKIAPSRILIPLSFASQFGGVCTLVGSSTNLIVNSIAVNRGMEPFGFFEFLPLGLAMVGAGIVYLAAVGHWLLPTRKGEAEQIDKYRLIDYLMELQVTDKSPLIGQSWQKSKVEEDTKVELANLLRGTRAVSRPTNTHIQDKDILLLHGNIEQIMEMQGKYGLKLLKDAKVRDKELSSHNMKLSEVLIPPESNLIGRTLNEADIFHRHRLNVLAIQRRGRTLRDRLANIKIRENDTILLQGHKDDITHIMNSPNVVVTNELTELYLRKNRAFIALAVLLVVVFLTAFNVMSVMLAAILGAVAMVVTQCLTIEEAYKAIDWKIIFLLVGVLPMGLALEESGATLWLATNLLQPLASHGPIVLLATFYLVTALLTEAMSNNASAAILAPLAFTTAASLNLDPRPLLVAITFAASTSFATPIGYKTNTMIYSPGGYKFTDFTKVGVPLNLIFWGLSVLIIPLVWPL